MKKLSFIIIAYLCLGLSCFASESMIKNLFKEGDYQIDKATSHGDCPDISLVYQDLDKATKLLMLNPRLVFNLSGLDKKSSEKVSQGCTYEETLNFKEKILTKVSHRSHCPNKEENGSSSLSLQSEGGKLQLALIQNKKSTYNCFYKKGGK